MKEGIKLHSDLFEVAKSLEFKGCTFHLNSRISFSPWEMKGEEKAGRPCMSKAKYEGKKKSPWIIFSTQLWNKYKMKSGN